ncbi:MAG TPA: DUF502 domain-containing protein [Sedimentisphaerales bacterium]|nr:DUF502 domain-containing protein [Sedimentisphaerales bacterium]
MIGHFKSFFLRGLAVLLPTILTIWIFVWGYSFIQNNISIYINRGIVQLVMVVQGLSGDEAKEVLDKFWINGPGSLAGFVLALVAVCIVGAVLASVVGRSLWRMIERFMMGIPFLKRVYPYIKQITDFLLTKNKLSFSRVVAFQYPRLGVWAIGLVTSNGLESLSSKINVKHLTVFIPTAPTPFTGFIIMVPKEEVVDLDVTIEEAIRFIVSGGVITPGMKLNGGEFSIEPGELAV